MFQRGFQIAGVFGFGNTPQQRANVLARLLGVRHIPFMNYRHIFHAGSICDVVKHAVLTLALASLRSKDKPFCVLDTHAGIGLYDLEDERARKTGEAEAGILRLLAAEPLPELDDYYRILRELNPDGFRFYPGSPLIERRMLREHDRLILCELHEEDYAALKKQFRNDDQAHIHHRDGYEALGAFLPPAEKRGLVLIDPPFEQTDEFAHLATVLIETQARWPQGTLLAWYPVKERPAVWGFHEALLAAGMPKMFYAEFIYQDETRADRLNGCGIVAVNPPWRLDEKLQRLFAALHKALKTDVHGVAVKWLTDE
jgi:23S rRNA (adenine2030-N6)-methyltransferase